jgi:chromate transporter
VAELAFLNLEAWTGFSVNSLLAVIDWKAIVLAVAVYFGLVKFKKHPIIYIALSAVVGIIFQF